MNTLLTPEAQQFIKDCSVVHLDGEEARQAWSSALAAVLAGEMELA